MRDCSNQSPSRSRARSVRKHLVRRSARRYAREGLSKQVMASRFEVIAIILNESIEISAFIFLEP